MAPLTFAPRRRHDSPKRPQPRMLGDKLQMIATLSPKDLLAIEVLADFLLAGLDEHDHDRERA